MEARGSMAYPRTVASPPSEYKTDRTMVFAQLVYAFGARPAWSRTR